MLIGEAMPLNTGQSVDRYLQERCPAEEAVGPRLAGCLGMANDEEACRAKLEFRCAKVGDVLYFVRVDRVR